jgi:hypothetical protein
MTGPVPSTRVVIGGAEIGNEVGPLGRPDPRGETNDAVTLPR